MRRGARARLARARRRRPRRQRHARGVAYARAARTRLRRFRQATALAVAATGFLLIMFGAPKVAVPQDTTARGVPVADSISDPSVSIDQATGTLRELGAMLYGMLPKIAIALALLVAAALITSFGKALLRRVLGDWERATALSALSSVLVWLLALGAALSVLAGNLTALVGSVGLFGLALSWALQAPIESFSGWLLNSFRGYYRVGDRIEVGEVFGDVIRIDVLTTMLWEAGGADKAVQAAQSTGAIVTFPNSEVLRANIINYTRDFPYVWDEISIGVTNGSDLSYAAGVLQRSATSVVGEVMATPVMAYRELLQRSNLQHDVSTEPQVYATPTDSYVNFTIRYLVPARERRVWATRLFLAVSAELRKPEHRGRIEDGYPRRDVALLTERPGNP